jgi:four helix bundle protein
MKGDDIAARLAAIATAVIKVVRRLPNDSAGRLLQDQLLRSGTSPGGHYAEARSAGSSKAFIYKVNLAAGELREAVNWLDVAMQTHGELAHEISPLRIECGELVAILATSAMTARRNATSRRGPRT